MVIQIFTVILLSEINWRKKKKREELNEAYNYQKK